MRQAWLLAGDLEAELSRQLRPATARPTPTRTAIVGAPSLTPQPPRPP